jgi:uncharacterized membrane protein YqiK
MTEATKQPWYASHDALVAALAVCSAALTVHTMTSEPEDQCHSRFDLAALESANKTLSKLGVSITSLIQQATLEQVK